MEFKYIIIDRVKCVLFSHGIEHIDEANGRNVTSAGFVKIWHDGNGLTVECFGRSESLNIDGKYERDARIIWTMAANMVGMGTR